MIDTIKNWLQNRYQIVVHSIAFYPVLIGFLFLIFSAGMIWIDNTEWAQNIKFSFELLNLNDVETSRTIVAAIAGGIISLTVFSFSMVMIVLNQAASNLTNRVLDNLIGNRTQQVILGFYIGTIVYSFFLLTAIRGPEFGNKIPSFSIFMAIILTIFDIFLFIYFLHYITQSVKFDVVIKRIYRLAKTSIKRFASTNEQDQDFIMKNNYVVNANYSGIFEGFNHTKLVDFCTKNQLKVECIHVKGTYVLVNTPLIKTSKKLEEKKVKQLHQFISLVSQESIEENFIYGIRQLREIAVKALSPGINDPGTAIESLKAIFQLFNCFLDTSLRKVILDKNNDGIIYVKNIRFEDLFDETIPTIWDFGKKDRTIKKQLLHMLDLLHSNHPKDCLVLFLEKIKRHSID